jgi:hypothetical protein
MDNGGWHWDKIKQDQMACSALLDDGMRVVQNKLV